MVKMSHDIYIKNILDLGNFLEKISDEILCQNVTVANVTKNDGHQQTQPLQGYFFIVLTLPNFFFSDINVQCSDTGNIIIGLM